MSCDKSIISIWIKKHISTTLECQSYDILQQYHDERPLHTPTVAQIVSEFAGIFPLPPSPLMLGKTRKVQAVVIDQHAH